MCQQLLDIVLSAAESSDQEDLGSFIMDIWVTIKMFYQDMKV